MDYRRQEIYFGKQAQRTLQKRKVVIIGVGALGTVAASLLARSGVPLLLVDRDVVEKHNLQRQIIFTAADVGKPKASIAARYLRTIFPGIRVESKDLQLDKDSVSVCKNADVVLDCTDNFFTRFVINDYCKQQGIPWVHGSALEEQGYVLVVQPAQACFRCIFEHLQGAGTCATLGVLNTITSAIASIQVSEALKLLLKRPVTAGLIHLNLKHFGCKVFPVQKRKNCKSCSGDYEYLERDMPVAHFCGSNKYQFAGTYSAAVQQRLRQQFPEWVVSPHRIIIRARDKNEALHLHSKYVGH